MAAGQDRKAAANKLYSEKKYEDAVLSFTSLIDDVAFDFPDLAVYHSNRSACYMQLGKFALALEDAETCKSLKPTWYKSYSRLGSALIALRRNGEAIHALEKAQELDPANSEVESLLARARGEGSGSGLFSGLDGGMKRLNLGENFNKAKDYTGKLFGRGLSWWVAQTAVMQQGLIVGAVVISYFIISTLFFSAPTFHGSDDFLYDEDDYDSHRRGRGGFGGGGHYGLSWTMWMAVMGAAYQVPPMFPQVFGDYARPFFGMSFTTFMYMLNMFTQNQQFGGMGGGGGLGGLFGGGGRRRGRGF